MASIRLAFLILLLLRSVGSMATDSDSVSVMKAVTTFVGAFNSFNWETFRSSFADDATMFHPTWDHARRVKGRGEIEAAWLDIFPEFKDPKNMKRLEIDPKDINLQLYGETAIVTFHLGNGTEFLSRRTVVMVKKKREWKIVHIHASRIDKV